MSQRSQAVADTREVKWIKVLTITLASGSLLLAACGGSVTAPGLPHPEPTPLPVATHAPAFGAPHSNSPPGPASP